MVFLHFHSQTIVIYSSLKYSQPFPGRQVTSLHKMAAQNLGLVSNVRVIDCVRLTAFSSVADPDPGSGIGYLFYPWIRDPGWEKVSIRIRDPG
jgi:hypothetical protein